MLGYSNNLEAVPSSDSVSTLERAYDMLPGRGDVAYNLLLGYARAGKRQDAIDLVATAEARGVSEEQLAPARQTLLQLDFQYAVALVREKKYDEAVPLLEKIGIEAADAGMRQRATELLEIDLTTIQIDQGEGRRRLSNQRRFDSARVELEPDSQKHQQRHNHQSANQQDGSIHAATFLRFGSRHNTVPKTITITPIQIHTTAGVTMARRPMLPSPPTFIRVRYRS